MHSTNSSKRSSPSDTLALTHNKFSKARTIAERLDVCPKTIFRWANQGKITRHKINARMVLFEENEILELLNSSKSTL